MIKSFNLEHISASPSRFDFEKLKWINKHYIKESKFEDIRLEVVYHFSKQGLDISNGPDLQELVAVMAEKVDTLVELAEKSRYFYNDDIQYDENAVKKHFKSATADVLKVALEKFKALSLEQWQDPQVLHHIVGDTAEQCEVGMGKVGMPLRVAITGSGQSPDIGITLKLLGKEKVISRISNAINNIANK
jgi:glutamyl-tRNA synthetase